MGKDIYLKLSLFVLLISISGWCQMIPDSAAADTAEEIQKPAQATEEVFSLDDIDEESAPSAGPPETAGVHPHARKHGGTSIEAVVAVDFTFERFFGEKDEEWSFSTNHEYLVLGMHPHPNVTFLMEIIDVVYWEFQYLVSKDLKWKLGKIAPPFGPLFLHPLLGGVVGKPLTGGGEQSLLLPLEWTEYGIELDYRWIDSYAYSLETKAWLSNGLSGSVSIERQTVDITNGAGATRDNNRDKAVGLRVENTFYGKYQLNLSGYTCRWDDATEADTAKWFFEGDRIFLGNADVEIGYNVIPLPFLKNLKFRGEYALMHTRSTQRTATKDERVPWHYKSADFVEVTYNGLHKWCDIRFRAGRYDDNWDVLNSKDLINYNISFIFEIIEGVHVIPMLMFNRERVNEVKDDFAFTKFFIEL